MAKIGTFKKGSNGSIKGRMSTLALDVELEIVPVEKASENAPSYRVYSRGSELGAGWPQTSETGTDYISLKLDDLSFSAPVYVSLFPAEGKDEYSLLWQRPSKDR
jgi:uncharacterized protein (DUF736 family)